MRGGQQQAKRPTSVIQRLFTLGLIVLFLSIALVAGVFVFDQVRHFIAASDNPPPFSYSPEGNESGDEDYDLSDPLLTWEGKERVSILVMGIDQRAGVEQAESQKDLWRTDTMLVLTIDPVTMTGGMLSIPRDLWVPISDGYGMDRINTAHFIGEADDYPGGGPALAVKTVEDNLGVHIHYYARVNFTAFEELVDLIGGIDVTVEEEINDPTYPSHDPADPYGYDPLYIAAGQHHFDGEMALKYARTRHGGTDFDRAERQQEVLMAIFKKVTRLEMLPTLASQAPQMWRKLQDSVETDLRLDEIIALARLSSQVEPDDIRYGVIDENYTWPYETDDGQQVLVPLRDKIRELRDDIFTAEEPSPEEANDATSRLEEEAATIEVLNGTLTEGLAASVKERLLEEDLEVVHIGNAQRSDITESLIIARTGKTYTAQYVAHILDIPEQAIVEDTDPAAEYDISVILGADYQSPGQ